MKTGRKAAPAIWLWHVVDMVAPRAARISGFVPTGGPGRPRALELKLPAGWRVVRAEVAPAPEAGTFSRSTRSEVGALTWYDQPLTLAR